MVNRKIALIVERMDISLGGAERSVYELADALSAIGLKVDILAAKGKSDAENVHILCQNTPGDRTGYFTFANALRNHLLGNHYDIIHSVLPFDFADVYQPRGGSFAEAVLRNAASYQNKIIELYKRTTAFANFRRTIFLRAERKLCKHSNRAVIVALSKYVAEQFKKHYGVSNDRVVVIPNGIKVNKRIDIGQANSLRNRIFAQLGIKKADNYVFFLFAANNFRLKGLVPLINAMHFVTSNITKQKAYLVVVGNDRTHKYDHLAKKLNIHGKIVFLGHVRDIQETLLMTDVAVLPTFYDPSSRFILEAIAAGKPVITTEFNGASDLFINDRHGKVIDSPENIPALAQAISFFTDNNNIQQASQAIIEDNLKEKISISRVAEQLISLYEYILENKGQS